MLALLSS